MDKWRREKLDRENAEHMRKYLEALEEIKVAHDKLDWSKPKFTTDEWNSCALPIAKALHELRCAADTKVTKGRLSKY